jgi:hypothetical protein
MLALCSNIDPLLSRLRIRLLPAAAAPRGGILGRVRLRPPLLAAAAAGARLPLGRRAGIGGRGLHSSTFQLNLSRF